MNNIVEYDYLCHYGILGMKWGVRRYQNPDGTRTAAGKARYGERPPFSDAKSKAIKLSKQAKATAIQKRTPPTVEERKEAVRRDPSYKNIKENMDLFTNEELNELATRSNALNRIKNDEYNAKRTTIENKISKIREVKEVLDLVVTGAKLAKEVAQIGAYGYKIANAYKSDNKSEAVDYLIEWASGGQKKQKKQNNNNQNASN